MSTRLVPGRGAILTLTRAPAVRPPDLSPVMVSSQPRAHAPSVCRSLRSGAEINIPVQAATGTSIECIMPRQKALDLGLHCLLEDINEGFDYFGLVNCKIPGNMMLHGSRPDEGLDSLLHVYCSKQLVPDMPFFANTLIIGSPGVMKMKMSINYGVRENPHHPKPCPYRCCNQDLGPEILGEVRGCDSCGRVNEDLRRCPCRTVSYCNEVCQKRHWRAGHKRVCSARVS
ncbi:hypothetical protein KFL_001190150 [Klebsormidium nitens]|uniref:MYND-type domain-containing protein n=1 Tax=Klebsormidium nitens TaxID=105231 RepID=A0A0U9HNK4_KLENI|nr:hypothetical protein KFL_001190150 [Klebsormidium nitens]|eukprot:GAQ82672.1 hypothetical protein KFL_001190150 [Klebsormidium nitens]